MSSEINSIEAKNLASYFIENAVNNVHAPPSANTDVDSKKESEQSLPEREVWGSKAEFLLSCVGLSVGIGNVWRFPYMAYQNGGGAFLLPYVILLIFVGKPMYFLEVALGQYSSLGPMAVWRCFPLAKGIGVAMVIVSIVVSVYYNVVMSYTLFYMAQSFRSELPWSGCYQWWGADNSTCYVRTENKVRCPVAIERLISVYANRTNSSGENIILKNNREGGDSFIPVEIYTATLSNCTNATQTASEQFWERYVLDISSGIDDVGTIKWDLALCVFASWTIIFLCLRNGVKSSGKVVYFTATFPYVVLFTMLIYGVTLDGASDGIYYFFVPNWESLLNIGVWRKAAEQLFYSLSISWGGLILFGSYNQFNNKVYRDAMFVSSLDFFTCFISGIVIFAVLGNTAKTMGLQVEDVVKGGQGLAFVAYPEALAGFWFPQLWSFLFFMMLFLLGVDSEFAYLETFLTSIYDEYPKLRNRKTLVTFLTCSGCFLIGLPCVTQGGQYIFNLMDNYCGSFSILFVAICELMALMWGYGKNRLCDDLEFMLGFRPGFFWQSSWLVISPVVLTFIFVFGLAKHTPITYNGQPYPSWAENLGWFLALVSMVQIPLWAIFVIFQNRKNLKKVLLPSEDWGPGNIDVQKELFEQNTSTTNETAFDNPSLDVKPEIIK